MDGINSSRTAVRFREHVKVGKALYSVPWRLLGQQVHARTCGDIVQIVHDGDVVATHVTHHRGRATDFEH